MNQIFLLLTFLFVAFISLGQTKTDTLKLNELLPLTVEGNRLTSDIRRQEDIQGTYIYAGKKNEIIDLTQKNIAITEKYGRQIFAKIPGVFVYDMDGTGNQVNISARGLDPHRGWEFNIRKDGILTNSDMYGYPASHYSIPMEAVERIELLRGTGSMQYGAQFGGMLNYISKQADTTKQLAFESINTMGSYGLLSAFNRVSGKTGKFRYAAWVNRKSMAGYRENSESKYDAEALTLYFDASKKLHLKWEWTHSNYLIQLAGPLTDSMFHLNPKMATRSRNYYNPNIHIPSFTVDWMLSSSTQLWWSTSAVIGSRNSVMFDKPATVADSILSATLQYNKRQVDIDHFNSYTSELRLLQSYKFLQNTSSITLGMQYMNNDLHRQQQGKGSTGSDYDLSLLSPEWGRDLHFKSNNLALFAENKWVLAKRFSINTGARIEMGQSKMTGFISNYSETDLPTSIKHQFTLFGVSSQFDLTYSINLYAGWSQAYRPVIFKDIIPQSVYEVSDKNLKDASGYNAELGFRGKRKFLKWDVSAFFLQYNNRLGTLAQADEAGNLIVFRTNIGNSRTSGLEVFVQGDFRLAKKTSISVFTSTSFMDARYLDASLKSGNKNVSVKGNKIESVPSWISRNGFTLKYAALSFSLLYSYTSQSFSDALNTIVPPVSGANGLVPSYTLLDLNLAFRVSEKIELQLNVNNALDQHYFTKRPQFYPGPGIWPSDGRTLSITASLSI